MSDYDALAAKLAAEEQAHALTRATLMTMKAMWQTAEHERRELERDYAAVMLSSYQLMQGQGATREMNMNFLGALPHEVLELVLEHAHHPVALCEQCGKRAPLVGEDRPGGEVRGVCAWGCEVKP